MSIFNVNSASFNELTVTGSVNLSGSILINGSDINESLLQTKYGSLLLNYDNDTTQNPVTIPPYTNYRKTYFKMDGNWVNTPVTKISLSMLNYKKNTPYYTVLKDIVNKQLIGTKISITQLKTSITKTYKILSATKYENWDEENINYTSDIIEEYIPGFVLFDVVDVSSPTLDENIFDISYLDDEHSIDFDFSDVQIKYEKTVITNPTTYTIPLWAKKLTIIAIGGGGGGGGGVGIYSDTDYPFGDSADLIAAAFMNKNKPESFDIPENQFLLYYLTSQYYTNKIKTPIKYDVLVGGGGGAGGNVVWKELTLDDFQPADIINIFIGKGGKGGIGGNGQVINRTLNSTIGVGTTEQLNKKWQNGQVKEVRMFAKRNIYNPEQMTISGKPAPSHYMYVRSGKFTLKESSNSNTVKNLASTTGGDTRILLYSTATNRKNDIYQIVAEGGYGGFPGFGVPRSSDNSDFWITSHFRDRAFAYVYRWPLEDDNGVANPWLTDNYQSHPGATHKQTLNNTYDGILLGGPGGHGTAMPIQGQERFFNYAPSLPWNVSSYTNDVNNFFLPWGSAGKRTFYDDYITVGYDLPSDYAPTGGGGGNGPILEIVKARNQFMEDNPGQDIDSIPTIDNVDTQYSGKPGFYWTHDTAVGLGGINNIQTTIFGDIPLGQGGNGGNFFDYPPNSLSPSLPTSGGLYGGGGGGGASLYFDPETLWFDVNGQNGADGGDGVVVIIAES